MTEIIDCEDKYCAECGVRVVKSPRRKYCSTECAKVAERKQWAASKRKKRGDTNFPSSVQSSVQRPLPKNNAPVELAEKKEANFPLASSPSQEQFEQLAAIIHHAFKPLFFSLNQRLVETNDRIQAIEDMQDEMFFTFYQSPEFQKQMKRQQYEIAEAKRLIIQHEKRLLLSQIRIILEEKFQISKRVAEGILKKAHNQLQHERNNSQRSLDDWEART